MAYCGPRGIPHSHFIGGPNAWDQHSRDAAIAWQFRESKRCGQCGTFPEDYTNDRGRVIQPPPYIAQVRGCEGCRTIAQKQDEGKEDLEKDRGLRVTLVPNPETADDGW